jgi:hypothetical protein
VHQLNYTIAKVFNQFDMDKSNFLCTKMIAMSFDVIKDHVMSLENDEPFELIMKYHILIQMRIY